MSRIYYVLMSNGVGVAGGQKMCIRHVETLRDLGFDAMCYLSKGSTAPNWFDHRAPMERTPQVRRRDVVVVPDDNTAAIKQVLDWGLLGVIFAQNPYYFAQASFGFLGKHARHNMPVVMAVTGELARTVKRAFPEARTEVVRCFADERRFRPGPKRPAIAFAPKKRPEQAALIQALVGKLHPRHAELPWTQLANVTEAQMAETLGVSSLCLSLSRLESVGMTTLEAMASGALCAGFTGVGGQVYATPDNGLWVGEGDCEAATDALAEAADITLTGGARLNAYLEAGLETARQWSYARFRTELEETWMRLAPQARISSGPLDPL